MRILGLSDVRIRGERGILCGPVEAEQKEERKQGTQLGLDKSSQNGTDVGTLEVMDGRQTRSAIESRPATGRWRSGCAARAPPAS